MSPKYAPSRRQIVKLLKEIDDQAPQRRVTVDAWRHGDTRVIAILLTRLDITSGNKTQELGYYNCGPVAVTMHRNHYVVEAGRLAQALAASGLILPLGFLHKPKRGRNSLVCGMQSSPCARSSTRACLNLSPSMNSRGAIFRKPD